MILKSEFEDALQTTKKNKAPGPDELNTELLQQTGDEIKNALYELSTWFIYLFMVS